MTFLTLKTVHMSSWEVYGPSSFLPDFSYLILSTPSLSQAWQYVDMSAFAKEIQNQGVWVGPEPKFQHCLGQPLGSPRNPHTWGHIIFVCLLAIPCSIQGLNSPSRDWTHAPCIGAWSHNRSTTRKVPEVALASLFSSILPSPPEHLVLWAHTEPECLLRGLLLGPVSYLRKMSPESQLYHSIH